MKKMAKRKTCEEYRTFQDDWTEEFAFVERAGSVVYLICNDKTASMKRSNIKRHFDTRRATFATKYPETAERKRAKNKIIKRIQDMPLSARTVHDHQVEETQVKDIHAAPFFSLALDESTDISMCDEQLSEVMSLVIHVINFIVARALNDRQFKTLLDEVGNHCHDQLLHSNVRWLSRGKVLSRFVACIEHPELAETEWLLKFYYLVDMTEHLNQLNVKMQFIGNTVLSLQQAVFAFENKMELFIMDLETGHACTATRFGEFREHTRLFKFITHPNECSLNTADLSYIPGVSVRDFQTEVADLKASDMWVNKFKSLNEDLERIAQQKAELLIIKTWNKLPVTYHTLQRVSIAVLTIFGSTYACESFSHLKNIKSNLRSRLTDESLNACMKLNITESQPDYKAISKSMQHQKSH
uniref:HAT C-terminal dimerisation domain-containing protein n=1 Tax=Periophthalmus magnuspinnatus TaxID=409849 RepID=A0A3B4APP5_9GOBI